MFFVDLEKIDADFNYFYLRTLRYLRETICCLGFVPQI